RNGSRGRTARTTVCPRPRHPIGTARMSRGGAEQPDLGIEHWRYAMRRTNVWRFLALAVLGIPALATPGTTQIFPDVRRAYDARWGAYADQPEELVRTWYRRYLNRDVDPVGFQTWVGSLRSGNPPEMVLAGILASDEYFGRGGGTPEGYVTVLFQDLT